MSELTFLLLGYALEHLLASGIIALVVLTLCRTKAISPGAKARILLAALMLSVLGPVLPLSDGIGADTGSASWQADAVPMQVFDNASGHIDSDIADRSAWAPSNIEIGQPMSVLLIAFWFFGVVWQLARQAKGYVSLRQIIATSKRSRALEDDYRHLLKSGVEICLCASFGPAVVGALRPKILVPEQLAASLPEDALRAVILHEASHIRRNDVVAHAFQKIVEALFWWNPMIRWMGAALDVSREIACDIEASRLCKTPADYADALLTAVEHIVPSRRVRFASALGIADALRTLDQRIDGIIEARAASGPTAKLASMGVLLSMIAACAAAGAVSHPLAPIPANFTDTASVRQVASKPKASVAVQGIANSKRPVTEEAAEAVSRSLALVPAGSPYVTSAKRVAPKPKASVAIQRAANSKQTAAEEYAARLSADEEFRRTASQADEEFRRTASQADEEFRRTASQADQEYIAAAQATDATYQRRFAELEQVTPSGAFEARLSQISRERNQTMSVAIAKYRTEMARAKERFESATKARRMN